MAVTTIMRIDQDTKLLRLFQLVSSALPVGAFSYSQGLETAVEHEWVVDASSTMDWVHGILDNTLKQLDAPILLRLFDSWANQKIESARYWNDYLLASRETRELREEDCQLGSALAKLLDGLQLEWSNHWLKKETTFSAPYSFASVKWSISKKSMIHGYLWSWMENQVLAAVKLVPLGQLAAQKILYTLADEIPGMVEFAFSVDDQHIGASLPIVTLASSNHETQYCRLFRS